jgi:hypothetical protein
MQSRFYCTSVKCSRRIIFKRNAKYTGAKKLDLGDWFFTGQWPVKWQLYERFYSDIYDYVINLVWFK